jgi:DNA primase
VVAALGTALTEDHVRLLSRYAETVVMCYDADAAGMAAALRNLEVFERAGAEAQIVTLPQGLDPDELVRSKGLEGWEKCLATRQSLAEYELDMIFAGYRNQGVDGLARAATKAVNVLLKVQERTRRDSLLHRAAELWAKDDPRKTMAMREALSQELSRRTPRPTYFRRRRSDDSDLILQSLAREDREMSPGRRRLERQLLATALQDRDQAVVLFGVVQPSDFGLEEHRLLANALEAHAKQAGVVDIDYRPDQIIERLAEGNIQAYFVSLLLSPGEGLDEKDIRLAAEKLRSYRGPAGLEPVYEIPQVEELESTASDAEAEDFEALRARITERLARGEISREDPDYRRYLQLVQRARGRGEYDFWSPPGQRLGSPPGKGRPSGLEEEGS